MEYEAFYPPQRQDDRQPQGGPPPGRSNQPLHRGSGTRFSGAPLWRFTLRRDEQRRLQEVEEAKDAVPEGFVPHSDGWYWSAQQRLFWRGGGAKKLYTHNEITQEYIELLDQAFTASLEQPPQVQLAADASSIPRQDFVREDRHVMIRDLAKAAQALKMPIDHLPRPSALFAIYDGHRALPATGAGEIDPPPPTCSEFCARNFHLKLLPRLSALRAPWDPWRVVEALKTSCEDVDAEFLSRSNSGDDGCSAAFVLQVGRYLFLASVGAAACLLGEETEDGQLTASSTVRHLPSLPAEMLRIRAAQGSVVQVGEAGNHMVQGSSDAGVLPVSRAFGNRAFKDAGSGRSEQQQTSPPQSPGPLVSAEPDVRVVELRRSHRFVALACGETLRMLREGDVAATLRRRLGRPRVASGALVHSAQVQGARGSLTALCIFLEWRQEAPQPAEPPPAKRQRGGMEHHPVAPGQPGGTSQVRLRQILVRHKDSKEPTDRVRGAARPVTRSLAEAEQLLRETLEAIESSPGQSIFTQRCKAISECSTCLKGGEMAGDLGWISRGQVHPAVEAAAFALPAGHISDIVESDEGVHVLWRIA